MLSVQDIRDRLHRFNLTYDFSVFDDVPEEQSISVMYPEVFFARDPAHTAEEHACARKQFLNQLFGELKD
jgi:hypothetical protein